MRTNLPISQRERQYADGTSIISITDPKGRITYVNADFIEVSGFTQDELLGQPHNLVRHPDMPAAAFQDLWDTVRSGRPWRGLVKNRCKNGDHYWVDAYVTPVYERGALTGYQSVRTKPTAGQVREAEALYRTLREKNLQRIPKQTRLRDVRLTTRIWLATLLLAGILAAIGAVNLHYSGARQEALAAIASRVDGSTAAGSVGAELRRLQEGAAAERRTVIALLVLGAGLLTAYAMLVIRTTVAPLGRMANLTKQLAGGDLQVPIAVDGNDEVGEMLQSLKMLQARFKTVIGQISEAALQLAAASEQLSRMGRETLSRMEAQHLQTDQVATAMNEMAATVQEVAQSTVRTAEAAHNASEEGAHGSAAIGSTVQSVADLSGAIAHSDAVIRQLNEHSKSIGRIIAAITAIAEQTNLLALNAAIEAARAGDAGRGFAVVADEVRALAQKTQTATQEISATLGDLTAGVTGAVQAMGRASASTDAVIARADETMAALGRILDAVSTIADMSTQVATATEQQSTVAEEMSARITEISQGTEETTHGAKSIADAGANLSGMAVKFQRLLGSFNLGSTTASAKAGTAMQGSPRAVTPPK